MKICFTSLLLLSLQVCLAQSYSGPESAEFDSANNRWLISNTQSHQILSGDQSGILTIFASGISSGPYGIEIVGDTLFCCCGSNIRGYLLSDGSQVFNVNIGATFLNGITHDSNGNLFVTDFSAKTIHRLNINSQVDSIVASGLIQSPNGIIFDQVNARCVFVNWGNNAPVKAIDVNTYSVSTIVPTTLTNCDGIARDGQGKYYISNWGSQSIVQFDSSFASPFVTVVSGLNNPADIFYNTLNDTLAIPNAGNNTVTFYGFSTVGVSSLNAFPGFTLYPNPVNQDSKLTFTLEKDEDLVLEMFTFSGSLIWQNRIQGVSGKNEIDFSVGSTFPSGIYNLRIANGNKARNMKIIF